MIQLALILPGERQRDNVSETNGGNRVTSCEKPLMRRVMIRRMKSDGASENLNHSSSFMNIPFLL
jgi:hypothetical protein